MLTPLSKACWFHIPCRQNPTNTSRPLQSRPHPPATIPSNTFSPDSLLFQSFPKHRNWQKLLRILTTMMVRHRNPSRRVHSRPHPILTEVPFKPCDHNHIGAHLYWQKFLLTLATVMVPHRSPPILTEIPSNPCDHNGPTSEPNKYK